MWIRANTQIKGYKLFFSLNKFARWLEFNRQIKDCKTRCNTISAILHESLVVCAIRYWIPIVMEASGLVPHTVLSLR